MNDAEAEAGEDEDEPVARGRPRRAAQQHRIKGKPNTRKPTGGYDSLGSMDDESDATSSGNEWDGGDEDEPDDNLDDEEEDEDVDMSDNSVPEDEEEDPQQRLVVSLRYTKRHQSPPRQGTQNGPANSDDHTNTPMTTSTSKGPSETADSTDGLMQSSNEAPKSNHGAAPTQYSRSIPETRPTQHAPLKEHATSRQYIIPIDPQPQVSQSNRSMPNAPPGKVPTPFHSDYPPLSEAGAAVSSGSQT